MTLTRRGWMGAAAGLAAAGGAPVNVARAAPSAAPRRLPAPDFEILSPGRGGLAAALEPLRAYALAELNEIGLPGMTLCVTDLDGFSATLALGWADRDRQVPLTAGRLFQIGSISKSFIALTVLALADEGKLDLAGAAHAYLPQAPWPETPITVAQLLSHVGGLPDGSPVFPRTPDGRLWSGFPPGSRFSYSNTGFELLGRVIERATGRPHQEAVDHYVRGRLGISGMAGTISEARRADFAVGYWAQNQMAADSVPGSALEAAYWTPEDTPAGSVGATSGQMAVYLRALMKIGRGEGVGVLTPASTRRFATGVIAAPEFGVGARYACGVAVSPIDGVPCLHHTGGMMSFSSSFHADPAAGVACFASVNARLGAYRPRRTTAYAIQLLRAAKAGGTLPKAPDALAPYRVRDPAPFVGTFAAAEGAFTLSAAPMGLRLKTSDGETLAFPQGEGGARFIVDHPRLSRYGLDAVKENGQVVGFWWGETLFGRDKAPAQPVSASALKPLSGAYLNRDPWVGLAEIHVRGDTLVLEGGGVLKDRGDYWSLAKDAGGIERLRFEAPLNDQVRRLNASGADLLRLTT